MRHMPSNLPLRRSPQRQPDQLPPAKILSVLKAAAMRPTRQRVALGTLLFAGEHRHVTADALHQDAMKAGLSLSLATIYNTLNQFAQIGLVRRVAVNGGRTYFDTDVGDHQHFYIEGENRIIDIPAGSVRLGALPKPPHGYRIVHVDVVIRLMRCVDGAANIGAAPPDRAEGGVEKSPAPKP